MRIKYTPRWQGAIQGHAVNTIKSFYPSLSAEYEFDDLMQEAYIVYIKVKNGFRDTPENPINAKWFMAMFSRSLVNKLINIKARSGRYMFVDDFAIFDVLQSDPDENFILVALKQLPQEVKDLIHDFCFTEGKTSRDAHKALQKLYPDAEKVQQVLNSIKPRPVLKPRPSKINHKFAVKSVASL